MREWANVVLRTLQRLSARFDKAYYVVNNFQQTRYRLHFRSNSQLVSARLVNTTYLYRFREFLFHRLLVSVPFFFVSCSIAFDATSDSNYSEK